MEKSDLTPLQLIRVVEAARLIVELNCNYVEMVAGPDNSTTVRWDDMTQEATMGMINAVIKTLSDPPKSPEEQHDRWVMARLSQGWKYGPVADKERKLHPNLVPYDKLSTVEQFKDCVFATVVISLARTLNL